MILHSPFLHISLDWKFDQNHLQGFARTHLIWSHFRYLLNASSCINIMLCFHCSNFFLFKFGKYKNDALNSSFYWLQYSWSLFSNSYWPHKTNTTYQYTNLTTTNSRTQKRLYVFPAANAVSKGNSVFASFEFLWVSYADFAVLHLISHSLFFLIFRNKKKEASKQASKEISRKWLELFGLRKLLILWIWTLQLRDIFITSIFQNSSLSFLTVLNTAFGYYE